MSVVSRLAVAAAALAAAPAMAQEAKTEQPATASSAADPFAGIPPAKPADVASMDAIIAALYDVISGDAGVERDWDRFRSLFYPGARMIPTGPARPGGKVSVRVASPEAYIKASEGFLEGEGFHEQEISRKVDAHGAIAQVFSAYEARKKLSDPKPFLRGVNSIQLLNDGTRWWVLTVAWAPETPQQPLPERLTRKTER
jgi:hypothetical protein